MSDFTKPVQTRDGHKVRILCTDGPDKRFPIVGYIGDAVTTSTWTREGRFYSSPYLASCGLDLVQVAAQETVYANLYPLYGGSTFYASREEAQRDADDNAVGLLRLTFRVENGQRVEVESVELV